MTVYKKQRTDNETENTGRKSLIAEFDIAETGDSNSSLELIANQHTLEILRRNFVFAIHFGHDFYNPVEGYPNGLRLSEQYNFVGIVFPRKENTIFTLREFFGDDGKYNPFYWKRFFNFRSSRGVTRNYEGQNTTKTMSWIDIAINIPVQVIPANRRINHEFALQQLNDDSGGNLVTANAGKYLIKARICIPFTLKFEQIVESDTFKNIMNEGSVPLFLLQNMIIQKTPYGYSVSTQNRGFSKSEIVLIGKIDVNTKKFNYF